MTPCPAPATEGTSPLAEAERMRFAAALAHELRTPLVGILGFSELLLDDASSGLPVPAATVRNQAELIRQSGERLLALTQRCELWLDLTTRSSASPDEKASWRDEAWHDAVQREATRLAGESGRTTDLQFDCTPAALGVPSGLLAAVVRQLIDNAFKFSRPGDPVVVSGSLVADSAYALTVTDGGRGFPLEQRDRIAAFVQFDRDRHEQQGLGLGLAIAQGFAGLVGGSLTLAAGPEDRGTTVTLRLPCARVARADLQAQASAVA